jgi:hypothetical protein
MDRGGRWNRPGSFPVVFLNRTKAVARRNLVRKLEGQPYRPEDLRPGFAPELVSTEVPSSSYADIVTDVGCVGAGLPTTYSLQNGTEIPRALCQPIGQHAWDGGEEGIACRSATTPISPYGEEIAWFQRSGVRLQLTSRVDFETWFFTS